ncbi:hypothetical protein CIHG_09951 [Coccidioides immitis H538.4]|uniref:Uncharacterized protein n=3 Tax=Coccidioides TaxID=5500 RepID=A0A0J8R9R6_COCIT|nr:hypothetical protein CPAG_00003 [Coccidioides posadasii RMSCC 3488]KMU81606.1 hypothetical protein CISG_09219 [Coccidioides immitis RMSCC 3703]KMU92141.1 hypothetical protein CIHG_09951 [Coccidioides immitis H538.4]
MAQNSGFWPVLLTLRLVALTGLRLTNEAGYLPSCDHCSSSSDPDFCWISHDVLASYAELGLCSMEFHFDPGEMTLEGKGAGQSRGRGLYIFPSLPSADVGAL